jgi:cytochrome c553
MHATWPVEGHLLPSVTDCFEALTACSVSTAIFRKSEGESRVREITLQDVTAVGVGIAAAVARRLVGRGEQGGALDDLQLEAGDRPAQRRAALAFALALAWSGGACGADFAQGAEPGTPAKVAPPAWLYPVNPEHDIRPEPDPHAIRRVPGSAARYTNAQVDDLFIAPDWHPREHASAPAVVSRGRPPETYACGYCHRVTGAGAPENSHLAGLPAAYIRQQVEDVRTGARRSSRPERIPQDYMAVGSRSASEAEIDEAARWFAAQAPVANFRVVQSRLAPSVHVEDWKLMADRPFRRALLGHRLLELPDDPQDFTSRDTRARFTVYAPIGSVDRGRVLAQHAGTTGCAACHGPRLQGMGSAPPLVGQSPSYLLRQLVDFGTGARHGPQAVAMIAVARTLSLDDMIAAAAYAASLSPSTRPSGR